MRGDANAKLHRAYFHIADAMLGPVIGERDGGAGVLLPPRLKKRPTALETPRARPCILLAIVGLSERAVREGPPKPM